MKYVYIRGYCNPRWLGDRKFIVHVFQGARMLYTIRCYPKFVALFVLLLFVVPSSAATVSSRSGVTVSVAPSAQSAFQCVINHVESAGVKIKFMRGYGRGSVRASLHPSGQALDINQTARGRTSPHVPRAVANAAGSSCGVVSGGTWSSDDTGHWNIGVASHRRSGRTARAYRRYEDAIPAIADRHTVR